MKAAAAIAALSVLIVFPGEVEQCHPQNNVLPACNNGGRCTTPNVTAPTSGKTSGVRERSLRTSEKSQHVGCAWRYRDAGICPILLHL